MQLPDIDFTSNQAVFDHVAAHLLKQGKRCVSDSESDLCQYRKGDMACSIGCLMTDEEAAIANRGHDGSGAFLIEEALRFIPTVGERLKRVEFRLLEDLQNVHDFHGGRHDSVDLRKIWRQELERIAEAYSLVWRHG